MIAKFNSKTGNAVGRDKKKEKMMEERLSKSFSKHKALEKAKKHVHHFMKMKGGDVRCDTCGEESKK